MKKKIVSAVLAAVLAFSPAVGETGFFPSLAITAQAASTIQTPKASLASGTYCVSSLKKVTLSCKTKDAVIWYSVNGGSYKKYTKPLTLSKNTTLKFYAKSGSSKSKTATCTYKFTPDVTITPNGGDATTPLTVKAKSQLSGVKLYYTLDGSKPTKSSPAFPTAGIKIDSSCTLRVLALKTGFSAKYYSAEFTSSSALTVGRSNSILNDYTKKYYYQQMTDRQKQVYRDIWDGLTNHKEIISMSAEKLTSTEFDYVWWLFTYDNPQFYWVDTTVYSYNYYKSDNTEYLVELLPQYCIQKSSEEKRIGNLIQKKADEILTRALKEKSDYEVLASIYASVNEITEYFLTNKTEECSIIGPFVNGKAQCEGYAMALMYLCQSVGIPSMVVTGTSKGEDHAWNKVNINGSWCQLDVTWDDSDSPTFCYFCVSDMQMSKNHDIGAWQPLKNAAAVTEKYNYYSYMHTVYDNTDTAYRELLKQSAENFKMGVYDTTIYCGAGIVDAICGRIYSDSIGDHKSMGLNYTGSIYSWITYETVETGEITLTITP